MIEVDDVFVGFLGILYLIGSFIVTDILWSSIMFLAGGVYLMSLYWSIFAEEEGWRD